MPRVLLVTSVGIHRNKDRPAKFCSLKAKIGYLLGASGALVSGGISMGYAPSNIGVLLVLRSFVPSCLVSRAQALTHTYLACISSPTCPPPSSTSCLPCSCLYLYYILLRRAFPTTSATLSCPYTSQQTNHLIYSLSFHPLQPQYTRTRHPRLHSLTPSRLPVCGLPLNRAFLPPSSTS